MSSFGRKIVEDKQIAIVTMVNPLWRTYEENEQIEKLLGNGYSFVGGAVLEGNCYVQTFKKSVGFSIVSADGSF